MATQLSNFRNLGKKIVCVGRNYKEHALELGNTIPKIPLFFLKSTNSYVSQGQPITPPPGCKILHQEVELGVIFSKTAKNIPSSQAFNYIGGYTVALDMTARDFQDEAKKAGAPWFLSKSFDTSCPVGSFIEINKIANPHDVELFCRINDVEKQRCRTDAMIFDIPTLIEVLTEYVTMEPGDMLLTGTPSGVTAVKPGDWIEFGLEDIASFKFYVQQKSGFPA
ncbi:fumarylacetoacetate hydrolase domain containing 1 [Loa loa]|uniref:Oxaloacetate tautomerase FAHD1, mitochondrial n=1 Tax=Loa loa TaxID=7209 RepID=A0A1I7V899_LOALO|nr:fumarylacetoacetate hydrolase domain containing 1 [Loa loa]EFO18771.1 fumarylacetoacetate hydrolase domain containing 1 [Loa loa]